MVIVKTKKVKLSEITLNKESLFWQNDGWGSPVRLVGSIL